MKFGVREITDVVFKAKKSGSLGGYRYTAGQPVLYIDSAKTSTIEGTATTVYAQGGRGNARLIAWEGEKTLTFTVEDALLSDVSFAVLSGAGLLKTTKDETIYVHQYEESELILGKNEGSIWDLNINLKFAPCENKSVFVLGRTENGSLFNFPSSYFSSYSSNIYKNSVNVQDKNLPTELKKIIESAGSEKVLSVPVIVDYYSEKKSASSELAIDAGHFAGNWYVEAMTDFRRQSDGKDLKATLTFPNVKIQSNFTFAMAATGDPSTFTFTMDALPGYVISNKTKQVMCIMQIIDEDIGSEESEIIKNDSILT